jgi:molybdenum cofactor cytidylyltransferase
LAIALLAAGSSRRFVGDKLLSDFGGQSLVSHAASALIAVPAALHVAIVRPDDVRLGAILKGHGFALHQNPGHQRGLSRSIHCAVERAKDAGCDALLIALADMPFVTTQHLKHVVAHYDPDQILTTAAGDVLSPPALFPKVHWPALRQSEGDRGAGALLKQAQRVEADPKTLADVDTPEMRDALLKMGLR